MLLKRQSLLLSLLDSLGAPVGKTDFQKLLFLYTREFEAVPSYEFVPYRFGCFSFTASADHRRLVQEGLLEGEDEMWKLTAMGEARAKKDTQHTLTLWRFKRRYESLRGNALIAQVYRQYPYYAIHSEIAERVLSAADRELVQKARPAYPGPGLLTIGYEGRTLEGYLNALLQAGVNLLCDVRRNPISRKYGFSKSTLRHACEGVGIDYQHLPELGIASEERQELNSQTDYDALFEAYERTMLPLQEKSLTRIKSWVNDGKKRVALTCYERLPIQCHRHCVAEAVERVGDGSIKTIHL